MAGRERSLYERLRRAGNGMLNNFQFVGPLRGVDYAKGTLSLGLHQTDERRTVDIVLKNIVVPRSIKEGQRVRVNGYVRAVIQDGVRQLRFHAISVRDCLDLSHFDEAAQRQWKQELQAARQAAQPDFRVDDETFSSIRHNFYNPGHVGLEGFVDAIFYEKKEAAPGEAPSIPCLHILLRQFENTDLSVPVRLYGRRREATASVQTLMELFRQAKRRGRLFPLQVSGRTEVEIRDIEVPAEEEGQENIIKTVITPIIKLESVRMIAPDDYRRFMPHEVIDSATGNPRLVDFYPWASTAIEPEGDVADAANEQQGQQAQVAQA